MHKIYYAKIKPLRKEERYQLYYNYLPNFRQKKVDGYTKEEDKLRSVAAFSLLLKLLNDNHITYQDEDFKVDKNGKPYLENSKIYFNISHGGDYVIAAISDHLIGVDVENIKRNKNYKELAEKVFNAEEINEFHHAMNKRVFFYQIWTLKESYIKCIGEGLKKAMTDISISSPELKGYNFKIFLLKNHQFAICNKDEPVVDIKEIKL